MGKTVIEKLLERAFEAGYHYGEDDAHTRSIGMRTYKKSTKKRILKKLIKEFNETAQHSS